MLRKLRDYLQQNPRSSIVDMAIYFDTEEDALKGMLEKWVAKGKVIKTSPTSACCGCYHCDLSRGEVYTWLSFNPRLTS